VEPRYHEIISAGFSTLGVYLLLNAYRSLPVCGLRCGSYASYSLLYVGSLFVGLAAVEGIMAMQRKRKGTTVWETPKQKTVRRLGIVISILGSIVWLSSLFELNVITLGSCLGCIQFASRNIYQAYDSILVAGLIAAALGAAMVPFSTLLGMKTEKWRMQMAVAHSR